MAPRDEPSAFAALLRRCRQAAGLSQEELAELAGLSRRGISDLERGQRRSPHLSTVRRLAEALGLRAQDRAELLATAQSESAVHVAGMLLQAPLPNPLTSFVGRQRELTEVRRLLEAARLVTLTGVGGIGKTRLALEAALAAPDVTFVDLAAVLDDQLVVAAVAAVLGVPEQSSLSMLELVASALAPRRMLLILDNCEHLIAACSAMVDHLLRTCPHLRILATSRQPLGLAGEQQWPVPPLMLGTSDEVANSDAVRLFVERARLVQPGLALNDATVAAMAEICRRLDGIPLAIELAAARTRVLSVDQIAARLDDRFHLLTKAPLSAPKRQQTLLATLDWSYELLSPPERTLLRRLTVFAGGCSPEAAEAICSDAASDEHAVFGLLAQLVDKSLVVAEPLSHGEVRYRLLETVGAYAIGRRAIEDDERALRGRHAAFFLAFAERVEPDMWGTHQRAFLDNLEREHENLRAALQLSADTGCLGSAARLCGALWRFWATRGHMSEGRRWIRLALDGDVELTADVRARALNAEAWLALLQADYAVASTRSQACLSLRQAVGDVSGVAESLMNMAEIARQCQEYNRATALIEKCLALRPEAHQVVIADALNIAGMILIARGDQALAGERFSESLALHHELGDVRGIASTRANLGDLALLDGNVEQASAHYQESLALRRELGDSRGVAIVLGLLGDAARRQGQVQRAQMLYEEGLELAVRLQAGRQVAACRDGLASLAAMPIADRVRQGGSPTNSTLPTFASVQRHEGIEPDRHKGLLGPLTPREREVAGLVAQWLTNREIANVLRVSERTVHSHLRTILSKLAVRSRAQIAAIASADQQPA